MKIIFAILGILVLVVVALIAHDVAATPKPTKGQYLLVRHTVLPDACVNSCQQAFDCTASTRPYGFFFTQAASCEDAVICQ